MKPQTFKDNSLSDADMVNRGLLLAEVLGLKQKPNGRYDTTWGDKTPLGLYLTVQRIIEEGK
jgi:hypothetical protein